MTAIADFGQLGGDNELFRALDQIVQANNGLWCAQGTASVGTRRNHSLIPRQALIIKGSKFWRR